MERCFLAIALTLFGVIPPKNFADEGLKFDVRVVEASCVPDTLHISTCNDLTEVLRKLSGFGYAELAGMASQHYRRIFLIPAGKTRETAHEVLGGTMDIIVNSTSPEGGRVEVNFGYDINPTNGDSLGGSHQFSVTLGGHPVAISTGVTTATAGPDQTLQTTIRAFLLEASFIQYQTDEN